MSRPLGVAACQLEVVPGDIRRNLENMVKEIELIQYYSPWVNIIVASELAIQGSSCPEKRAEPIPGPITDQCAKIAKDHGIFLIPGSIYESKDGKIYNTCPVFSPGGELLHTYHKMYPWRPHENTASGKETLVFDIPGKGRMGLCNCYDLWFPELIRDLAFKGAEVIFVPTAAGTQDRRQELILAQAAAIQNQCYIVSVNGLGVHGVASGGRGFSLIVDPQGNVIQRAGQLQENLIAMLDLDAVTQSREFGVAGTTRPLAAFFHEKHRFTYQTADFDSSPVYPGTAMGKK
ncbi:MAG: carbon-nitrogen hydrolase family protein [Desulfobacterales bacterium]|nr:carbon-nitrogen hydrolase family protein [Desulfobacterales bacterium]